MARQVQYCTAKDGTRLAYAVGGAGVPFVFVPGWVSHLELDDQFADLIGRTADDGILFVTMDKRGNGLSERHPPDVSLESRVSDLETVTEAVGLDKFALGGLSEGGPVAIAYAARHPEQVEKLVIVGSYADGSKLAGSEEMRDAVRSVVKAEWGMASRVMAELFVGPDSLMDINAFAAYQQAAADPEEALAIIDAAIEIDVRDLLAQITAPTLVVHHREDRIVPIELGQQVAAGIPGARFVSFPGAHIASPEQLRESFEVINDFVRGGPAAPAPEEPSASAFRTVLFSDLVGHTEMMSRLGDERGREVLREQERITRETLAAHGGTEVKTMGDGFMASFTSVTRAVECAVALQKAFSERNAGASEPLHVRVGLNAGEPIEEEGDLFGSTVILASRLAAKAGGGEILASDVVRGLCSGKGFLFADCGEFVAKGFEEPVRVFQVSWQS
ncbi:MAG TPA: alpha/beta fold hydrolase [Dehalococcoidia bacterium]